MISVVVCTRGRPTRLLSALKKLCELDYTDPFGWEIRVIGDRPESALDKAFLSLRDQSHVPIHYHEQSLPGLNRSRNAGIEMAQGNIVAFIDDDCFVSENWLQKLHANFVVDESLAVLGGAVHLYNPADFPITIRDYSNRVSLKDSSQLFRHIIGCNMAFRKTIIEQVGGFDEDLGVGTATRSAGDIDFIYRCHRAGLKVEYDPEMIVFHNHGRQKSDEVSRLRSYYLIGRGAFYAKYIRSGDKNIGGLALHEVKKLIQKSVLNPLKMPMNINAAAYLAIGAFRYSSGSRKLRENKAVSAKGWRGV